MSTKDPVHKARAWLGATHRTDRNYTADDRLAARQALAEARVVRAVVTATAGADHPDEVLTVAARERLAALLLTDNHYMLV